MRHTASEFEAVVIRSLAPQRPRCYAAPDYGRRAVQRVIGVRR